jgi:uncharacterized protein (TIGR02145 family)
MKPKIQPKKNMVLISKMISLVVILLCTLMVYNSCQKEEPLGENQILNSEAQSNLMQLKSTSSVTNYLLNMIGMVKVMVNEGSLNKGIGNSLIVKIENAIRSYEISSTNNVILKSSKTNLEKGNKNAFNGQLNALINQIEAIIRNGMITSEDGQELINKAESAIILSDGGFVDPRDGYKYSVVQIGDQLWMAENLRATKYNDGTNIPLVQGKAQWDALSTPGYCWYKNDFNTYGTVYGALYNWYAVETGKLSPVGWHVPTDAEWTILTTYLGGEEVAGGKLKETGTSHWVSPNEGATNESGFTALPADARYYIGDYYFLGYYAHWWSSSEFNNDEAWLRYVANDYGGVARISPNKHYGVSVRCIKD